jgi:adenosine deaminase
LHNPVPLRIWTAHDTDQLASQQECERFRELVFRLTLKASEQVGRGQLLLSLAGGRKTMSADLQRAASLFGAHRLLHVVDSGKLPKALFRPAPHLLTRAISAELIQDERGQPCLMPLIVGSGQRNELLDVTHDSHAPIESRHYPLPDAPAGQPLSWDMPSQGLLFREIDRRESEGASLVGNYLSSISEHEKHENWRQLYRLPTRIINQLRQTPLDASHRDWLNSLPKVDLHRHLGGCLDLSAQKKVAEAVWQAMLPAQQDSALARIGPLLKRRQWDWDWPGQFKSAAQGAPAVRSFCSAALLLHADDALLQHNLWGVTGQRLALKTRHRKGFSAYERPGELTGSAILQHESAIEAYAQGILEQAITEHLAYLELRGSPQKYLGCDGRAFLQRFRQALERLKAARGLGNDDWPVIRFVIIVDRRAVEQRIRDTVQLAVAEQQTADFVVGLDLAGDERHNPEAMAEWFAPAFEACLAITIHAGEGQSADNIWKAAYHLHADRIGHGLTLNDKSQLHRRFRDRGICLELCPGSNREVVGYRDPHYPETDGMDDYPLQALWDAGLALAVCTDNPGISRTDISGEYLAAARMSVNGISQWDALAMLKQGFTHAFLPSDQREQLLKRVDSQLYQLLLGTQATGA